MFMEHWKRRQMRLNYEWDLTGFEDEEVSEGHASVSAIQPISQQRREAAGSCLASMAAGTKGTFDLAV